MCLRWVMSLSSLSLFASGFPMPGPDGYALSEEQNAVIETRTVSNWDSGGNIQLQDNKASTIGAESAQGQYRIQVFNEDDDSHYIYFKTDLDTGYPYTLTTASYSSITYSNWLVTTAGPRTVTIKWTDPDDTQERTQSKTLDVAASGQTTFDFMIPQVGPFQPSKGQYRIQVVNQDDDSHPHVDFKTDLESWYPYFLATGDQGSTTYSNWIDITAGSRTITIKWIDPDDTQERTQSKTLNVATGGQTTFDFTIPLVGPTATPTVAPTPTAAPTPIPTPGPSPAPSSAPEPISAPTASAMPAPGGTNIWAIIGPLAGAIMAILGVLSFVMNLRKSVKRD